MLPLLTVITGFGFTVTLRFCAAEFPQLLMAKTETNPLVELAVVLMTLVDEIPVHPPGFVHE
jgi:hypothetical protein